MQNLIIFALTFLCACFCAEAQQMQTKKSLGERQLYLDSEKINLAKAIELAGTNELAVQEFKKARTNRIWGVVFSASGGACIGFPIGTALGGGDPNWAIAGIGAGLIGLSIPFITANNKRIDQGVEAYNQALVTDQIFRPVLHLNVDEYGLGLAVRF